ncbi:MAG TPA: aryl-sulfate sulfotransferase [Terracidiphilus sp.]|nr:aryl-sulfate sulfotransferase [Terracidiphilus sp.]
MRPSPVLERWRRSPFRPGALSFALISGVACLLIAGCADVHFNGTASQPPSPPVGPPPTPVSNGTVTITPQVAAVAPGQSVRFTATASNGGAIQWSVSGGGSIDTNGNYTAPATVTQSENVTVTAALQSNPQQDYATAVVAVIQPGAVNCPLVTGNPQVAQYAVYLPAPGKVSVQFGTTASYGLDTWQVPTPSGSGSASTGGQVQVWVAGMLGQTTYHMRGQIVLDNGATFNDADQTCTTGTPPSTSPVQVTATGSPQPGIEMWNTVLPGNYTQIFATDLSGNVIWTYNYQHSVEDIVQGIQLLPNGDLLMVISFLSSLNYPNAGSLINEVREIDLAGNTVRSLTVGDLNKKLASSSLHDAQGQAYVFKSFHHDVLVLPNGHWVILADYAKGYSNLPGITGNVAVLGDAIVDVDQNDNPDWAWNSFDHLDVNRRPMNFPDWTHSNGMLYSADDHNLLLSVRHQNWIIKIDFEDGAGTGNILWRLGYQGDFKLVGGTDPTDWFYAQHGMNYVSTNTTGVWRLVLMDNGNDRFYPSGQVICNPFKPPLPSTCYSTMPVLQIDESAMTATLLHNYSPGPSFFSYFGGNAEPLENGDYEAGFVSTPSGGIVQELDPNTLQPVWQAATPGADQYHINRWPSLYPGVQW